MNLFEKIDQLHLEPSIKADVAAMLQALMDQAVQDANTIHAKEAMVQARDAAIQT